MPIKYDVERNFNFHAVDDTKKSQMEDLRVKCKILALSIIECCPANGETMLALRALEECQNRANQSICRGEQ